MVVALTIAQSPPQTDASGFRVSFVMNVKCVPSCLKLIPSTLSLDASCDFLDPCYCDFSDAAVDNFYVITVLLAS